MIASAIKAIAIRTLILLDAGVVAGRDLFTAKRNGHAVERGKFQSRIARDARDRRFTRQIALYKRLDNISFEIFFEIQDIERKSERACNPACVVDVIQRATTRRQRVAVFVHVNMPTLIPQLHSKADKLVTLALK